MLHTFTEEIIRLTLLFGLDLKQEVNAIKEMEQLHVGYGGVAPVRQMYQFISLTLCFH